MIVISSLTGEGTQTAIDAMAAGAVDVVCKPGSAYSIAELSPALAKKIEAAARAKVGLRPESLPRPVVEKGPPRPETSMAATTDKVIALGASTGGVQALTEVLTALPATCPGVVLVQHMPARFTASFAERLNSICHLEVREAVDGDNVFPGRVLIAPGGHHMRLRRSGARYYVEIRRRARGPPPAAGRRGAVRLRRQVRRGQRRRGDPDTGMGADGAQGLLNMRRAGARTIAQDEATSTVFGMPMEAIKCGAAEKVLPLQDVARHLLQMAAQAAR